MNQLTKVFEGNSIRMIGDTKAPLFVASDIAKALGYKEPHKAVNRHCKGGMKHPVLTNGGTQDMMVIREPDVYRLVTNSKLPAAQAFENWIMEDVLPSIRSTGSYEMPKGIPFAELFASTAQMLLKQQETEVAITTLNDKIDQRMTLDYGQQLAIESAKKSRAEALWDEISQTNSELYPSKAKLYGRFGSDIKRAFAVASYRDIKQSQFEEALAYVKSWRPSLV